MKIKPKTWTPTAKNINSLPEPIRKYIHYLSTNADPAGTIAEAICQRENADALAKLVLELEAERNALLHAARQLMAHIDKLAKPKTDFGRATRRLRDAIAKAED